ncbi:MAG: MMPL family transporter, partial [Lachnospiraceae bacterium]|nr:MMPL family transporter [Lachnospiraceae bacterium]
MSKGLKVMNKEFDMETTPDQVRVMFTDLDSNDTENVIVILSNIDKVLSVGYEADSSFYNKKNHTLFVLTTESADANESVMKQLDKSLTGFTFCYTTDDDPDSIPLPVSMTALICVLIIMLLMCSSWIEPIIFFMTIGIAVLLNTGSNVILESVSTTTYGISAILQLVLSMDYSIILSNRYEQACKKTSDHVEAMTNAVEIAIPSVISSSLTTIVGLLALIFMSFTIGADLGIVLAKGVFCSLLCVFTALPALMLVFDKLVILTTKKSLTIPVRIMASLSYRARYILAPIFVLLFIIVFVGKSYAGITYDAMAENEVSKIFPVENQILILYDNSEENKITDLITKLEDVSGIKSITSYSNTLGKSYTASELKETISTMGMDIDPSIIDSIYTDDNMTFTIDELFDLLMNNDKYSDMLSKQQLMIFNAAYSSISSSKSMFVGKEHSRIIISTDLIPGSDEILKLGEDIEKITDSSLKETHYYIGNTIMALEMEKTFIDEMNKITLLTAIAIFIVVMLTFRSIIIPLILVLVIQGAVYLTMTSMAIVNYDMVYLALLIMQC